MLSLGHTSAYKPRASKNAMVVVVAAPAAMVAAARMLCLAMLLSKAMEWSKVTRMNVVVGECIDCNLCTVLGLQVSSHRILLLVCSAVHLGAVPVVTDCEWSVTSCHCKSSVCKSSATSWEHSVLLQ